MITAYLSNGHILQKYEITVENSYIINNALWLDLYNPTAEDERLTETTLGISVPTEEEMKEIEFSSRLYKENNALYMTASIVTNSETDMPQSSAVTFILYEKHFLTVRYVEPKPFRQFISHIYRLDINEHTPLKVFIGLLEASIDRIADILERMGHVIDRETRNIFSPLEDEQSNHEKTNFLQILRALGSIGDLGAKGRESLVTFARLLTYFSQSDIVKIDQEAQGRLGNLTKDISSLSDHASFLSSKVNFLLDATLGMINIEQNNIIKIFSVAAVIFLPPTLIASMYGMNFQFMPELHWKYSYPFAVGLMALSAWLPYRYFKHRKWL